MIPLASNSAYPFPEAELGGKVFWVPPVRQTGFLHQAAVARVGTFTQECPRVISALSTLSTVMTQKVVWRGTEAPARGIDKFKIVRALYASVSYQ
jgi:hypothetical protein